VNQAPKSTAAFDELIAALVEIRDNYVLSEERFTDPLDVVEAYRYVGQLLSATSELFFEADPDRPRFASIVSPARKLQGDNPDAIYHFARIRGDRSYRISGTVDRECYTSFTIHGAAADGPGPPPPLSDEVLAARVREGIAFLRQTTVGQALPDLPSPVPFVSNEPNVLPTPFSFRDSSLPVPGAADIVYALARWRLEPDEALVMTGTLPRGAFANVMLWNRHMQTFEYQFRQSSLNTEQITYEPDGSYTIVISDEDPGVPNWLDTGGHRKGTIFWRYLLPEEDPTVADCEVVPVTSLRSS